MAPAKVGIKHFDDWGALASRAPLESIGAGVRTGEGTVARGHTRVLANATRRKHQRQPDGSFPYRGVVLVHYW